MIYFIIKFMSQGQTVGGPCPASLAIVKAVMLLLGNNRFAGNEINAVCFKESLLLVLKVSAKHALNQESDKIGEAVVQAAAKVIRSAF